MKNRTRIKRMEFKGTGVVPGLAIGSAYLFGVKPTSFPRYWINGDEVQSEIQRFYKALNRCRSQLDQIKSKICRIQGREPITILDSHVLLLQDELLVRSTTNAIEREKINAEWALHKTMGEIQQAFSKIDQSYLSERSDDVNYILNATQNNLMGGVDDCRHVPRGAIIVAANLAPAELLHLMHCRIAGFVTEAGSHNSHTAIVARSFEIPAVVGVEGVTMLTKEGVLLIVDGKQGRVILSPRSAERKKYIDEKNQQATSQRMMKRDARLKAITRDGTELHILANMELASEVSGVKQSGAVGVGLFRTEFLLLDRTTFPDEGEQERIYSQLLRKLHPMEVTIRTLDLGADKLPTGHRYSDESNPAMGLRAIRLCMREKGLFTAQLRALMAASQAGKLKVCIPMVSGVEEFQRVKRIYEDLWRQMKDEKGLPDKPPPLGVMVETPSAALEMDLLAKEAAFFSVGTNDLIQYLLAVDRTNELVSYLYTPLHPAVIRTLRQIAESAASSGREVTVCGEMAADPIYLLLLMGLGYRHLSMNPASIPRIKKMIREASMDQAMELVERLVSSSSSYESTKFISHRMTELFPAYF